jgi:hypothetical protein
VGGDAQQQVWEYSVPVTLLSAEVSTICKLYLDRADCENNFDELKNQWAWGSFTTHDLKRCGRIARSLALVFNWWNLFIRLALT